jgi:hypothetical protein
VGSSNGLGHQAFNLDNAGSTPVPTTICPYRISANTIDSQSMKQGSTPCKDTNFMKWHEHTVGVWIDDKIKELNYSRTAVLLGSPEDHEENLQTLNAYPMRFIWFGLNDVADINKNVVIYVYFVRVAIDEDVAMAFGLWRTMFKGDYIRFYTGKESTSAYSK